jgi:prepilin-type N-terminal cleavage/methylation domain-containing protein
MQICFDGPLSSSIFYQRGITMQKKGFTLIELVIGLVLIGVGLISIMSLLQYSTRVTNTTKAQIVATNLAREGIEMVFNKRDTNRRIYSSKKDACRLVNKTQTATTTCENETRFTPGA